ncbi:MAG: S9 family peptidase [Planctomycetota bacterium]
MLTSLLCSLLCLPQEASERVALADLARIAQVTDVDVGPRGARAVFVIRSVFGDVTDREATVGYRNQLWLTERGSARARALTFGERGASGPAIGPPSADAGDLQLAFVRAGEGSGDGMAGEGAGKPQVWLMPLERGGEARQLTDFEHGASNPQWYPDGSALLVSTSVPVDGLEGPPPFDLERPARDFEPAAEDETDPERSVPDADLDTLRAFLADGATDADPTVRYDLDFQAELGLAGVDRRTHLWRVDLETGEATEVAGGWTSHRGARLSPLGTSLLYVADPDSGAHPDRLTRSALYRLDLASGERTPLVDDEGWSVGSARWSLDGSTVLFTATDQSEPTFGQVELARVPAVGGSWERLLPTLDRHVQGLEVARVDGRERALFRCPTEGRVALMAYAFEDASLAALAEFEGAVTTFDATGGSVAAACSTAADPMSLHWIRPRPDDGSSDPTGLRVDEPANPFAGHELSTPTERWTEAPDGTRVQYWVMPPIGLAPDGRAPVVLSLHGGPMVMWGPGSLSMWHEWQWLCARGYAVVYLNQRGSNGYGRAFQRANYRNWGAGPASDALAALEAAAAEFDWIDPDRAVVTGGSYAGYLTAWIVGHDDRFKAAVAQRGVYDLVTFFGEGNAWRLVPYHFGGYPWEPEVREVLMRESPFSHVDAIRTPLLVMHASRDLRTGVSQSEMLYRALKVLERPVEYVRYPDAGHDLSRTGDPHQRMDRLGRILEFFERYAAR